MTKDKKELMNEYRCYHFCNFYLSSIQQGIQSAHAQMELFNKYTPNIGNDNEVEDSPAIDILFNWSNYHKTMIVLNGGDEAYMSYICENLSQFDEEFPIAHFIEPGIGIKGSLTNIAVVLPEYVYKIAEYIRSGIVFINSNRVIENTGKIPLTDEYLNYCGVELTEGEVMITAILNNCSLAR